MEAILLNQTIFSMINEITTTRTVLTGIYWKYTRLPLDACQFHVHIHSLATLLGTPHLYTSSFMPLSADRVAAVHGIRSCRYMSRGSLNVDTWVPDLLGFSRQSLLEMVRGEKNNKAKHKTTQ